MDVVLTAVVETLEDVGTYARHPAHVAAASIVRLIRRHALAWTILSEMQRRRPRMDSRQEGVPAPVFYDRRTWHLPAGSFFLSDGRK